MIECGTGNLINAQVEAIVNTVNTEGVMGKGVALQVKQAFPDVFAAYAVACASGEVVIGRMHVVERRAQGQTQLFDQVAGPRYVINFPTKDRWRNPSKLAYIDQGLVDLVKQVCDRDIQSIAIPPLGCGLGGLDWAVVKPRIVDAFAALDAVRVVLFEPRM